MKRIAIQRTHWAALALLSLALTGCGGSDSTTINEPQNPPGAFDEVPASAKASATGYTTFAAGLRKSETAAGLDINQTTPPTSETEAPQPVL
jgi:hypothetical protein